VLEHFNGKEKSFRSFWAWTEWRLRFIPTLHCLQLYGIAVCLRMNKELIHELLSSLLTSLRLHVNFCDVHQWISITPAVTSNQFELSGIAHSFVLCLIPCIFLVVNTNPPAQGQPSPYPLLPEENPTQHLKYQSTENDKSKKRCTQKH
jgi:hypothetical protein